MSSTEAHQSLAVAEVALITGASSGIGLAVARQILATGGRAVLFDRDAPAAELQASLEALPGRFVAVTGDVRSGSDLESVVKLAESHFGGVDLLVNSAGVIERHARIEEVTEDTFRRVLDINLTGSFIAIRAAAAALRRSRGSVVNIASMGAFGVASSPAYSASKAGLIGLTRSLAAAFKTEHVRFAVVLPGMVATGMTFNSPKLAAARQAGQDVLEPEDVARAVLEVARRKDPVVQVVSCVGAAGAAKTALMSESWEPFSAADAE